MVGTANQSKSKSIGYTIEVADGFYDDKGYYHDPYYLTFPSFGDFLELCVIEDKMYKLNNKKV